MNALIELSWIPFSPVAFAPPLLEVLGKSFVIVGGAAILCLMCRRASAATRHLIWLLALGALPCLLLFSWLPHPWQRPLLSVSAAIDSGNQVSVALQLPSAKPVADSSSQGHAGPVKPASVGTNPIQTTAGRQWSAQFSSRWLALALLVWGIGVLLNLVRVLTSYARLRHLSRRAVPLEDPDWARLLGATRALLRLRRPVSLLQSSESIMPLTWGWWRCAVLLPAAASDWPAQRRRLVLLHELAHIKRWDCLTQAGAQLVCAFVWLNPLVWLAAHRMCVEREHACDDLVLRGGCTATDYATDLVEIAQTFRHIPQVAAIAMVRFSHLEGRIAAIVDASRPRRLRPKTVIAVMVAIGGLVLSCGGKKAALAASEPEETAALRAQQIEQLQTFAMAKEKQSQKLALDAGERISPQFRRFFDAATNGDWQSVTNMYESFKRRHPQYDRAKNAADLQLRTAYWSPVLEICLAYDHVVNCDPKYTAILANGIIRSIPAGSIYFGGTDPGRGVPTAFSNDHATGDPFFTITQNALADGTYLDYLRAMYGSKLYIPTAEDSQRCFNEYLADAQKRLQHDLQFTNEPKQIKPGEDVRVEQDNKVTVQGQLAVMSINGLMTRVIFDQNPTREFFVEESFPLDWMYPYLEPHGLIMKIDREALSQISEETVARDREYWSGLLAEMLGDWLKPETPVSDVTGFVSRVYVHKKPPVKDPNAEIFRSIEPVAVRADLNGFSGDVRFIQNDYAKRLFSKLRSSIGGVYVWRADNTTASTEKERMTNEADLAFRQAFAMCPYSPEAVFRYVQLLLKVNRLDDALLIAKAAQNLDPDTGSFLGLVQNLKQMKTSQSR